MDSLKSSYGGQAERGELNSRHHVIISVCQLVIRFSQKRLIGFFSKFYMKLEDLKPER